MFSRSSYIGIWRWLPLGCPSATDISIRSFSENLPIMSQPVAPPVVFDPHHFPNYTSESIQRDFTLFIYGLSIYEMFLCLNAYFKVCNKLKMKTPIFRLMTVAIFSMFVATLLLLLLQLNLTRMDLITNLAEYALNITDCTFLILDQLGYYIAATIRTRALLQKFPKTLYCFYFMLTITVITQFILMGFLADVYTRLYNTTAENFLQTFPITTEAILRYKKQATFTTFFNMVFANALAVSFLYPIFQTLEMDFFSAIKAMIKLGDVQKVLVFSASSIACVGFVGFEDPQISLAVLTLWLNTQNTQFLQLSYFSSAELLATHSKAGTYNRRGQSTTKAVESASHQANSVTVAKTAKVENV